MLACVVHQPVCVLTCESASARTFWLQKEYDKICLELGCIKHASNTIRNVLKIKYYDSVSFFAQYLILSSLLWLNFLILSNNKWLSNDSDKKCSNMTNDKSTKKILAWAWWQCPHFSFSYFHQFTISCFKVVAFIDLCNFTCVFNPCLHSWMMQWLFCCQKPCSPPPVSIFIPLSLLLGFSIKIPIKLPVHQNWLI